RKTGWCCPRYGPVRLGENVSGVSQPGHDLPCLNGDLRNTFLQHFGQITGTLRGVDAAPDGLCLEELLIDRSARYTIGCCHGRVLGDMTVDLSEQLPGPIFIGAARISDISRDTPTDAIG